MQSAVKIRRNITERWAYFYCKVDEYIERGERTPYGYYSELRIIRLKRYRNLIFKQFNLEQIKMLRQRTFARHRN